MTSPFGDDQDHKHGNARDCIYTVLQLNQAEPKLGDRQISLQGAIAASFVKLVISFVANRTISPDVPIMLFYSGKNTLKW